VVVPAFHGPSGRGERTRMQSSAAGILRMVRCRLSFAPQPGQRWSSGRSRPSRSGSSSERRPAAIDLGAARRPSNPPANLWGTTIEKAHKLLKYL